MIRYIAPSGLRDLYLNRTQGFDSLHPGLRVRRPFGTEFNRFESDFMVQYMRGKIFSKEAKDVLAVGKTLWQAYFKETDVHTIREELKLNRADVGWYQIRKALQKRNESGDFPPVSFATFETAYKSLTEELQPMVYELGFLKG